MISYLSDWSYWLIWDKSSRWTVVMAVIKYKYFWQLWMLSTDFILRFRLQSCSCSVPIWATSMTCHVLLSLADSIFFVSLITFLKLFILCLIVLNPSLVPYPRTYPRFAILFPQVSYNPHGCHTFLPCVLFNATIISNHLKLSFTCYNLKAKFIVLF